MKFYAIMFVWNEEDIIEATIKNIKAQGFDRGYFIDNGSTDRTIEHARKAGGILAHEVDTGFFEESVKLLSINTIIKRINERENDSSIWWMVVDADEFPDTGLGVSIRNFLECCPEDANAVKVGLLDHVPTHPPYYLSGFHPIFFQPFAKPTTVSKLLVRYHRGKPHLAIMGGAHSYLTEDGEQLTGPQEKMIFHHFPYRKMETGQRRLAELVQVRADGTRRVDSMDAFSWRNYDKRSHYWVRFETLADYYAQHANRHLTEFPGEKYPQLACCWHKMHDVPENAFASSVEYFFWKASSSIYSKENLAEAFILFKELLISETIRDKSACSKGLEICLESTQINKAKS
jgi:glycosyltransferase involved in cell wall biosynthesis